MQSNLIHCFMLCTGLILCLRFQQDRSLLQLCQTCLDKFVSLTHIIHVENKEQKQNNIKKNCSNKTINIIYSLRQCCQNPNTCITYFN